MFFFLFCILFQETSSEDMENEKYNIAGQSLFSQDLSISHSGKFPCSWQPWWYTSSPLWGTLDLLLSSEWLQLHPHVPIPWSLALQGYFHIIHSDSQDAGQLLHQKQDDLSLNAWYNSFPLQSVQPQNAFSASMYMIALCGHMHPFTLSSDYDE